MDDASTNRQNDMAAAKVIDFDQKPSITSQDDQYDDAPLRVTLSIGGMSCSSCSRTITTMLSDLQGVSDVTVSFLTKSAFVIVSHRKLVEVVVGSVRDCGYEAEVIAIESQSALDRNSSITSPRTVALSIDGMFCQ